MLYTAEPEREPAVVDLTQNDDAYSADNIDARHFAVEHGRTQAPTPGRGDCLFSAVAEEAERVRLVAPRRGGSAYWRREASERAREPSVQKLMREKPNGEWVRAEWVQKRRLPPESYADYIAKSEVWGNTFDVALLALCIKRMQGAESRIRLVVFSREGVHEHHPVGTGGGLCAKTRIHCVGDSDMCIGIDGCHWWSAPPTVRTASLRRPLSDSADRGTHERVSRRRHENSDDERTTRGTLLSESAAGS
jgi:hypothetical protein